MKIKIDNLTSLDVATLLQEHLDDMHAISPPESMHALDLESLRQPDITFWTIWDGSDLAGCGALKELDSTHGELKSMRTSSKFVRKGIGSMMLEHLIKIANQRHYQRLSLETGSMDYFIPARTLYEKWGFTYCSPFADYVEDPNSSYMTKILKQQSNKPG